MKIHSITLGCKVNLYESQAMLSALTKRGDTPTESVCDADVILINSCTVTAVSDQKVLKLLRRVRREAPNAVIVLTGCMTQAFPQLAHSLTQADIVLGNTNRAKVAQYIDRFLQSRERIVEITPHAPGEPFESLQVTDFYERTRAFVKIEDGCDRFCSYCIIPYARGRVRSKKPEDLHRELLGIAANGYKEVVLTGINLSAYGKELGLSLCDAVEAACAVEGIARVRLGSLEPEQLEPAVIARLAAQKKLCPQFHLSLQSGCDATLRRMNRHYSAGEYAQIVENLRQAFENCAITTDVMVGFAGETEEEFAASLEFVRSIGFAKVHTFTYSPRPGTRAYDSPDHVPAPVKDERCKKMMETAAKGREIFLHAQVGRVEQVLPEREIGGGLLEGYTANYTPVHLSGGAKENCLCSAFIDGVGKDCCTAQLI